MFSTAAKLVGRSRALGRAIPGRAGYQDDGAGEQRDEQADDERRARAIADEIEVQDAFREKVVPGRVVFARVAGTSCRSNSR